jgi:polyhydroxyalkanoate synthesis repressor PhaR
MVVIKRYPNRKLYNTEAKGYITLEGVAGLVRQGQEIQVVDNLTGEDMTTLTLTQIICEQEKKQSGFLPLSVLTGLIQAGGHTLNSLRNSLASPLELLLQIDAQIEQRIQKLINCGELAEDEGLRLRDQLLLSGPWLSEKLLPGDDSLEKILVERDVPTREDLHILTKQIEALQAKVEEIIGSDFASKA